MDKNETYLGDGVYGAFDGFGIRIWTSNGYSTTNQIYLEDYTLSALINFSKRTVFNSGEEKQDNG